MLPETNHIGMAPVTRSQTKHLRLPEKEYAIQQEMAGFITCGLNNFELVVGVEYKLVVALVLFKYIESKKMFLHLLGNRFCKVVSLKMDELINDDANITPEFVADMRLFKGKLRGFLEFP